MSKNACIISNFLLGVSLLAISIVPMVLAIEISTFTYSLIFAFDIIALFLAYSINLSAAKINNFNVEDMIKFVILPLVIPSVVFSIFYIINKI